MKRNWQFLHQLATILDVQERSSQTLEAKYVQKRTNFSAVASIEATESAASVVFHSSCIEKLKIMQVNSKNDKHNEKFFDPLREIINNAKLPGEASLNT